jgi:hypothetical protein
MKKMITMRGLEKRLRKLESDLRCEPDEDTDSMFALLWFAVAYYLGNPSRGEKPFAAYARALGYANESELNSALDNDPKLMQRFLSAEEKLYAKYDFSSESHDSKKLSEALKRMDAGCPRLTRSK